MSTAVCDIRVRAISDWFEAITNFDDRPDTELWEDWMWEVSIWVGKMGPCDTELAAYQLLHRLQGRVFWCHSTSHYPITDLVQGLVLEYIPGAGVEKLTPGTNISEQEAVRISSDVVAGPRAIEAHCLLHNDIHTRNVVLWEGDGSPVIIDFGDAWN